MLLVGCLPDYFMEAAVVDDPEHPFFAGLVIGNVDVGCMTGEVLGVVFAAYGLVQGWTTIAGADGDGNVEMLTQWFEDLFAEALEVIEDLL